MNNEIFETLLDQAERDFRTEVADIELIAGSPQREQDEAGDFDGAGKHPEDLAADLVEREIADGILAETNEMLFEIQAARRRLAAGTYGRCESCGRTIDPERLRAIPWARRCASDAHRHEAESRGQDRAAVAASWFAETLDQDQDNLSQTTLWDPQDDHQLPCAEELAVHQMIEGRS